MSDDRKYSQRGYQDSGNRERGPRQERAPQRPKEPFDPRIPRDPKLPQMPGYRQVFKCTRCGKVESPEIGSLSTCSGCGVDLHACIHCQSFDSGATFECMQSIPARVSPKDVANACTFFAARVQVERETGSTRPAAGSGVSSAKQAFDDLFK